MTDAFRTPDERFEGLPGFAFEPRYADFDGLRMGYIDVGEGPPVVMLHGEPTWSFIWRNVIPPIRTAGYRCIAPDHLGFGRSDKPTDPGWHSLDRHVEAAGSFLETLDLSDVTLVVHDWGGPIGLTVAVAHPDRVARIVLLDTAIDPRETWASDNWVRFREFVETTEDFPVGEIMRFTCVHDPGDEVMAGYEAPFPSPESKVALTALPMSVSGADDDAAIAAAEDLYDALRHDTRPMLALWGGSDLILPLASGERLVSKIGRQIDHVIPDAGHGLPEDQGPLVGRLIADWLIHSRP